jgi:hypothetical protein
MKKSIIKKSITRKISTAPFESLDVHVELEETIEWEDMAERMKKTDSISKILLIDFTKTLNQVADELNLDKKIAQVSGKNNPQNAKVSDDKKTINKSKGEGEFDFNNM